MVVQSFRLLSPRLGREIVITYYFKVAERTVVPIGSIRVVASNREFGPPTLRTAEHKFDFYWATTISYISTRILHFRRVLVPTSGVLCEAAAQGSTATAQISLRQRTLRSNRPNDFDKFDSGGRMRQAAAIET
jgi:hypothetical protein